MANLPQSQEIIMLQTQIHHDTEGDTTANERQQEFSLPPTDQGKDAWLCLAGAFLVEMVTWGFPYTFGIFQEHYSSLEEFASEKSSIPIIGTAALGILYLGSPVSLLLLRQYPRRRRQSILVGVVVSALALVAASFATRIWHLILTQGILYGIGASMMYYPLLIFIDEWFVRRKGLAYGVAWAGTGFSGVIVPFIASWSIRSFSYRTTLRSWAVVMVVLMVPCLPFVKPRIPPSSVSYYGRPKIRFALRQPFFAFQLGSILESLGYFLPSLWLPSYARYLGYSSNLATASVAILNVGAFFGCICVGLLVDRWKITNVILMSTIGATCSVVFLWGLSGSAAAICSFALLYGLFAGSFSATWPGVVQETLNQHRSAESGLAYAMLVAGRGIGSVASGPLSEALLHSSFSKRNAYGYWGQYSLLILFTGLSNMLGGFGFAARLLGCA